MLVHVMERHAQALVHFVAQSGLVDHSGALLVSEQLGGIQRAPPTVLTSDLVQHQRVGVQLRVPGPAAAMVEHRRHQPGRADLLHPVRAAPRQRRMGVQIGKAGADRGAVRRHRLRRRRRRRRRISQRPQRADALGRGERQIESGHPIGAPGPPQPAAGDRVQAAGEQRLQLLLAHHRTWRQPELLQPPAVPAPRRLTHPQVVLTRLAGHPVGVVPPRAGADLRRAQHRPHPLGNPATRPRHRTFEESHVCSSEAFSGSSQGRV